jgi:DNA-binding transcriptional MerR regulator
MAVRSCWLTDDGHERRTSSNGRCKGVLVPEALAIGRLAAMTGLPVKTIRFYSDTGLLPPSGRTQAGHRRYTPTDVARLQLVRTLRDLDVDLAAIAQLLAGRRELGELLAAHVHALEARDRTLHRQLAVLRAAAASPTQATLSRVHALSRLEAAERGRLLDRFWDLVTEGLPVGDAAARLRVVGTPELPANPTGEQLDAWLELAELAADADFQRASRANAAWLMEAVGDAFDPDAWTQRVDGGLRMAAELRAGGVQPGDPRAHAAAAATARGFADLLGRRDGPEFRHWLVTKLDAHTDPRVGRYWELVGIIQGRPDEEFAVRAADWAWLLAALRQHAAARSTHRSAPLQAAEASGYQ